MSILKVLTTVTGLGLLKKLIVTAIIAVVLFVVIAGVGVYFLATHGVNFISNNFPVAEQFLFAYAKDYFVEYIGQDVTTVLANVSGGQAKEQVQVLLDTYLNGALLEGQTSFEQFTNVSTELKNITADGIITPEEAVRMNELVSGAGATPTEQ